jgi:peptidoglycan/LPS O-acetylase OafA/YrhL
LAILSRFAATDITPTYWPPICYVANWVALSGHPLGVLNATWSLSVEEQFYIAWPLLLLMAARWRRGPEASALSLIMASAVLRCLTDSSHAYFGTDSQMGALLVGALLGISARRGLRAIKVSPWAIGLAPVPLLACGWWRTGWSAALPILVPAWSSAIIWAACCNPGGPLAWPWLRYLGRRSYAIYLWHYPLLWLAWIAAPGSIVTAEVAIGLTCGVAELSWRLVEQPSLGRVRRLEPPRRPGTGHAVELRTCRMPR